MIGQTVIFDGHRLNDRFFVGSPSVGLPEFAPELEERPSGDGSVVRRTRMGTVAIDIPLVAKPVRGESVRAALSDLVAWLDVTEAARLSLSSDNGLWRLVVPNGAPTVEDAEWNDRITVSFTQVEPALYGSLRRVDVPSGGSVSFNVGGDYPTKPRIAAPAAVRGSGGTWGVRLDDGDFLRVALPTASATQVEMDCAVRTCTVGAATTIPTVTSDWFELRPGAHAIRNDVGSGACVVEWYERWHR